MIIFDTLGGVWHECGIELGDPMEALVWKGDGFADGGEITLEEAEQNLEAIMGWCDGNEPSDKGTDFMLGLDDGINLLMANEGFTSLFKAV